MSYRAKTTKACERQLQGCFHKIEKWCTENGFKFSQSKTVCVHFHKKRGILDVPDLNLNGQKIKVVKETRFLGVLFDQKPPVRARGVKSRMCPPYPQRDRKRRLNGAVCRNHRIKRVVPCRC